MRWHKLTAPDEFRRRTNGLRGYEQPGRLVLPDDVYARVQADMKSTGHKQSRAITDALRKHYGLTADA